MGIFSFLRKHTFLKILLYCVVAVLLFFIVLTLVFRPSHDRSWELGHEKLPYITIENSNAITIENFRNFDWKKSGEAEVRYETKKFQLDDLETVDVFISHFDDFEGLAHIFLSFGFATGEHAVISLETRREIGEKFSPLLGLLRQFEILYVVGSEQDIVGLRTDLRNERVYLYPTLARKEKVQELFVLLAEDINAVTHTPRMYNTLTHNCTNELTRRVEDISDVDFPFTWKTVLPGFFDEILYDLSLIDTSASFSEVKNSHLIDTTDISRYSETFEQDLRKNSEATKNNNHAQ